MVTRAELEEYIARSISTLQERPEGEPSRRYLRERGYLDLEVLRRFEVGFVPPDAAYPSANPLRDRCEDHRRWQMRGRVVVPIRDPWGKLLGWTGRQVAECRDTVAQRLSDCSPSTRVLRAMESWDAAKWFHESFRIGTALFPLHLVHEGVAAHNEAWLVEGAMDAIACNLWGEGRDRTLSLGGTNLSGVQILLLRALCTNVVVYFDGDDAGKEGAERVGEQLKKAGFTVSTRATSPGLDPEDEVREKARGVSKRPGSQN